MKKRISAVLLLLAAAVLLSLSACGNRPEPRSAQEIIREIAVYHGAYGEQADGTVDGLLRELRGVDADAADRWESILALWRAAERGPELHYDALPDGLDDTDALAIVVLGFQLNPDGTMRDELLERLRVAKTCAEQYPHAYVVCTGGGTAANDPSATEAGKMAEWLVASGIDSARVIVEDASLTTAQNAIYTYDILTGQHPQVSALAIVSSDYHIATGALLFAAEAVLRAEEAGQTRLEVISNAACRAPAGSLSGMFQAGALIELAGDTKTAFSIYYGEYDIPND